MMKSLTTLVLLLLVLGTTILPAQAEQKPATAPIKLGFITSTSGVNLMGGQEMLNGLKLYLDEVHYHMGGRPIQLIVENDESSPATALLKVRKLVEQDKVNILCGFISSNAASALAPLIDRLGVPTVYPVIGSDEINKTKRYKWIVRTSFCASQVSMPLGEYAAKQLGYHRIATFCFEIPICWEIAAGFQKTFEDNGGKVVQKLSAPQGFTDFRSVLEKLNPEVDAVFFATRAKTTLAVMQQYSQLGHKIPIMGAGPTFDETYLREMSDSAINAVNSYNYSAAINSAANKKFVAAYTSKYKQEPSAIAEECYTGALWINKAVDQIGGNVEDKEKFLNALKHVELENAPRGPLKLDEYGNPVENVYVFKVKKVNGHLENTIIHTFNNVSQFWNYKPEELLNKPFGKNNPPCKFCESAQ
jgi:branched-chain amino acid transport system substrate-binding protein